MTTLNLSLLLGHDKLWHSNTDNEVLLEVIFRAVYLKLEGSSSVFFTKSRNCAA
jgi:hypothetical protein